MKCFFAVNICFLFLTSCNENKHTEKYDDGKVIAEVRTTLHNYYADIKSKGLLAELDYLDSSKNFFWVPPGFPGALTYDTVAVIIRSNARSLHKVDNVFETLQIFSLGPNLASYTGRLRSAVTDIAGTTSIFSMAETGILIKRAGGWKLYQGQTTMLDTKNF